MTGWTDGADTGTSSEALGQAPSFHLCPECFRATPAKAGERYCPNDGTAMLTACPRCRAAIRSPFARYCSDCGRGFAVQ